MGKLSSAWVFFKKKKKNYLKIQTKTAKNKIKFKLFFNVEKLFK